MAQSLTRIALSEKRERKGRVRLLKSNNDLEDHLPLWQDDRTPGLVMERADAIGHVRDLPGWRRRGLRMIDLTPGETRYGTGVGGSRTTFRHGGLTPEGFDLLGEMDTLGFIWDIAHLAEEGVWQGQDMGIRT